jgi:[acyl-carrier-protein] S-malonyltransferase
MNAIIFPGQGAQYKGMGKDLFDNFASARKVLTDIDAALGFKISEICFNGDEQDLRRTYYQQLGILAVSLAAYEVFKEKNIPVSMLSGLSLGEYTCLYPAGTLDIPQLAKLVNLRAQAMEEASANAPSCMYAVLGAEKDKLTAQGAKEGFYVANLNAPGQVVVSLKKEDKEKVKAALESTGARVIELDVGGGFHSPFMKLAEARLAQALKSIEFKDARLPIVSNFTAKPSQSKDEIKSNLLSQLTSPVLWKDCVEYMVSSKIDVFYEIGPSKVLRGLIRKINPAIKVINIEKKEDLDKLSV